MGDHQSQILHELLTADNRYVSGNELAKKLKISRPAVYNNILKLVNCGHQITTKKGLGYCYQGAKYFDDQVINHFRTTSFPVTIHTFQTLTSTNDYAKAYSAQRTVKQPQVFVSDTQTQGRGRLGRHFYSPSQTGIYMSFLIPLQNRQTIHAGLITTGTAVCVVEVLRQFFPQVTFQIKWVNDILAHHKKCGGILTETVSSLEDGVYESVIVGIGLNIDSKGFPDEITHKAGAVVSQSKIDRNQIVAKMIDHFFYMFQTYKKGQFLETYSQFSAILNKRVVVNIGNEVLSGLADHFDDQGALVIRQDSGRLVTVSSGEVKKVYLPGSQYKG